MVPSFEVNSLLQLRSEMVASAFEKNTWKLRLRELLGDCVTSIKRSPLALAETSDFSTDFW
jgi:hypothetical protein